MSVDQIPPEARWIRASRAEFLNALTACNNFLLLGSLFGAGEGMREFVNAFLEALRDESLQQICVTRVANGGQHEVLIAIEVHD